MGLAVGGVAMAAAYRAYADGDDRLKRLPGYVRSAPESTGQVYLGALANAAVFADLPVYCDGREDGARLLDSFYYDGTGRLEDRADVHGGSCPECAEAALITLAELDRGGDTASIKKRLDGHFGS